MSHPLGEYVLDTGPRLSPPGVNLSFDLSGHPATISGLEPLKGQSGWLELSQLELQSFQREEHLVFTAITDEQQLLDQEQCELLFQLNAPVESGEVPEPAPERAQYFTATVKRQLDATLSRMLDENQQYFQRERDKLEAWADDQLLSAEQQLHDTRARIKGAKRRSRLADTVEEQKQAQRDLKQLKRQQRRQRQEIFDVEDQIEERRDDLIAALERQMHQSSTSHRLFRVRWHLR